MRITTAIDQKCMEPPILVCNLQSSFYKILNADLFPSALSAQGVEGTGLAFIAFTEVMALFPASPFWSTLFFLMLLNLGLSTMFGTMQGILTPLMDNFGLLGRHRALLTGNTHTQHRFKSCSVLQVLFVSITLVQVYMANLKIYEILIY